MTRRVALAALLLLAGLLLAGVAFLFTDPFTPRRRLPDGTTVYLEAVTFGTESRGWIEGPLWRRLAGSVLPPETVRRLGWRVMTLRSPNNGLTLWARWVVPPRHGLVGMHVEVFDEAGNTAAKTLPGFLPGFGGATLQRIILDAFPRRGKMLGLRLWAQDAAGRRQGKPVEFAFANPAPGPYPVWAPDALPAVRRAGPLSVTLRDFTMHTRWLRGDSSPYMTDMAARYRVVDPTQPDGAWAPAAFDLRDATGNTYELLNFDDLPATYKSIAASARRPVPLPGWRSCWGGTWGAIPAETFRLRLHMVRTSRARPTREETWTARDLPVRGPGRPAGFGWFRLPLTAGVRRSGTTLRLTGIGGPRAPDRAGTRVVFLMLNVERTGYAGIRALHAVDERGRPATVVGPAAFTPTRPLQQGGRPRPAEWNLRFRVPADARRLSVTFAVHDPVTVEFIVRPGSAPR